MKYKRALFLQEMGITPWLVRKPFLFFPEQTIDDLDLSEFRLLFIGTFDEFNHPLTKDIINAFGFTKNQACYSSLEEYENYKGTLPSIVWSTVTSIQKPADKKILSSASILKMSLNPLEKKKLWEQYCALPH